MMTDSHFSLLSFSLHKSGAIRRQAGVKSASSRRQVGAKSAPKGLPLESSYRSWKRDATPAEIFPWDLGRISKPKGPPFALKKPSKFDLAHHARY